MMKKVQLCAILMVLGIQTGVFAGAIAMNNNNIMDSVKDYMTLAKQDISQLTLGVTALNTLTLQAVDNADWQALAAWIADVSQYNISALVAGKSISKEAVNAISTFLQRINNSSLGSQYTSKINQLTLLITPAKSVTTTVSAAKANSMNRR